jgi:hypothetical protein
MFVVDTLVDSHFLRWSPQEPLPAPSDSDERCQRAGRYSSTSTILMFPVEACRILLAS